MRRASSASRGKRSRSARGDDAAGAAEKRVLLRPRCSASPPTWKSARVRWRSPTSLVALGIIGVNGGVVGDAVDQLIPRSGRPGAPAARGSLEASSPPPEFAAQAAGRSVPPRTVRVQGGGSSARRFGWNADVSASPSGLAGTLSFARMRLYHRRRPAAAGGAEPLRRLACTGTRRSTPKRAALPTPDMALARLLAQSRPASRRTWRSS